MHCICFQLVQKQFSNNLFNEYISHNHIMAMTTCIYNQFDSIHQFYLSKLAIPNGLQRNLWILPIWYIYIHDILSDAQHYNKQCLGLNARFR